MEVGELGGEVVEGIVEGVAGPVEVRSILAEGIGEEVSVPWWVGDVVVVGMDGIGFQG